MPTLPLSSLRAPQSQSLNSRTPADSFLTRIAAAAGRTLALESRSYDINTFSADAKTALNKRAPLVARQTNLQPVPDNYKIDGPGSAAVVGIVLGSIAGFLLLVWLIMAAMGGQKFAGAYGEEEVVVRRDTKRSRRGSRSSKPDMRRVSRSPRRETIIVEERRRGSPGPPPPRPRSVSRSIILEERGERRVSGDDIVEVIEEDDYSERPRRHRRKGSYGRYEERRY